MSRKVQCGDKVFIYGEKRPYTVMARNDRYIICTKNLFGKTMYFIVDLIDKKRAPDDRVFCSGYTNKEQCEERLQELINGEIALSRRRGMSLDLDIC